MEQVADYYLPDDWYEEAPIPLTPLNEEGNGYSWGYLVMAFIVFSFALAVARSLFKSATQGKNIQKEISKKLRRMAG